METKIGTIFVICIAMACGMVADREYQESSNYYQGGKLARYEYQTTPSSHYSENYQHENHNENANSNYEYNYAVNDEKSGDIKSHYEIRDGDSVKGMYTLLDADGYKRIVEYTADKKNGFQATVRREPVHHHDQSYTKYKNDHESQNHRTIYKPTVPTVEKYAPIERYNSHSNNYISKHVAGVAEPEVKYGSGPEAKYVTAAPTHKYVTDASQTKYPTSESAYDYVTENPFYKFATKSPQYEKSNQQYASNDHQYDYTTEMPNYKYETQRHTYDLKAPQYKYATEGTQYKYESPQYKYGLNAPQYEYTTEVPQYKYATQSSESQYVKLPYRYITPTSSVERKPQNQSRPYYNFYEAPKTQNIPENKPAQEYNYGHHNEGFVYGH